MLVSFARLTVTVVRAGSVTDQGTVVRDWSAVSTHVVKRCLVDTTAGARDTAHRNADRTDLALLMPPGSDVLASDHIRVAGYAKDFTIVDGPRRQPSPTGRLDQISLALQVWEG